MHFLNVTDRVNEFCEMMETQMKDLSVRVEFDRRNEKLNFKIREAQLRKVPFMFIVGDKEAEAKTVSIRLRDGTIHNGIPYDQAIKMIHETIKTRKLTTEVSH